MLLFVLLPIHCRFGHGRDLVVSIELLQQRGQIVFGRFGRRNVVVVVVVGTSRHVGGAGGG